MKLILLFDSNFGLILCIFFHEEAIWINVSPPIRFYHHRIHHQKCSHKSSFFHWRCESPPLFKPFHHAVIWNNVCFSFQAQQPTFHGWVFFCEISVAGFLGHNLVGNWIGRSVSNNCVGWKERIGNCWGSENAAPFSETTITNDAMNNIIKLAELAVNCTGFFYSYPP